MIALARSRPRFCPGQLVRHKQSGDRGVVVEQDPFCQAPDAWYDSGPTQPNRDQPWYHVLVDGAHGVAYAAETNLAEDTSRLPVDHRLVAAFFGEFTGEAYLRNDRCWRAI